MNKHTPGPWKATDPENTIWPRLENGLEVPNGIKNAQLVAAAPDLFEAANAALRALDKNIEFRGLAIQLLNAIEKAEGINNE